MHPRMRTEPSDTAPSPVQPRTASPPRRSPVVVEAARLVDVLLAPAVPSTAVRVTVVLPLFNESGLIRATFAAVEAFALDHPDYAFIFVDDGSADGTADTVRALIAGSDLPESRVALLAYAPNRGKGHAVREGVAAAGSPLVLFTDGDLAYDLDHLPRLAAALEHADVAIGCRGLVARAERNTTVPRRIMGWAFNRCARLVLALPHRDTQAGLKGFRADAARAIFSRQRLGGFAFDVELVYLARRLGLRVAEIPARVSESHSYKRSKVDLLRDPARMFAALLRVRLADLRGHYGPR